MSSPAVTDQEMSLTEHLEDLRRVLIIGGGSWLGVGLLLFIVLRHQLLQVVIAPINGVLAHGGHLIKTTVVTSITETLTIPLEVCAVAAFALTLPVILWQVWTFVAPGLRPVERRFAWPFMASALVLFTVGATFAYFVMPVGLTFLAGFLGSDVTFLPDLGSYLSFFMILIVVFGVAFELPVVVVLLALLGIVSSRSLRQRRKAIFFGIILASLVITPGGDPFTPTALAIPLILLFEVSVLIVDKVLKR
ncbi:MAG: twin-arginine translocase subunit TatC [Candidatus Dormibacteria bacterium]